MINTENMSKVMGRLQSADGHLASIIRMVEVDLPVKDVTIPPSQIVYMKPSALGFLQLSHHEIIQRKGE